MYIEILFTERIPNLALKGSFEEMPKSYLLNYHENVYPSIKNFATETYLRKISNKTICIRSSSCFIYLTNNGKLNSKLQPTRHFSFQDYILALRIRRMMVGLDGYSTQEFLCLLFVFTSSSVASGLPYLIFSITDAANSTGS